MSEHGPITTVAQPIAQQSRLHKKTSSTNCLSRRTNRPKKMRPLETESEEHPENPGCCQLPEEEEEMERKISKGLQGNQRIDRVFQNMRLKNLQERAIVSLEKENSKGTSTFYCSSSVDNLETNGTFF